MPYVSSCEIPEFPGLRMPLMEEVKIRRVLANTGPRGRPGLLFLVLADRTCRRYAEGKDSMLAHIRENDYSAIYDSLAAFESCITVGRRALRLAISLAGEHGEREIKRKLQAHDRRLKALRDVIEHTDEHLADLRIVGDEPHSLVISYDGTALEVGKERLPFKDLAAILKTLRSFGSSVASLPAPVRAAG